MENGKKSIQQLIKNYNIFDFLCPIKFNNHWEITGRCFLMSLLSDDTTIDRDAGREYRHNPFYLCIQINLSSVIVLHPKKYLHLPDEAS